MMHTAFKMGQGEAKMSGKTDDVIYGWPLTSVSSARLPHYSLLRVTNWAEKSTKRKLLANMYIEHSVAFF